MNIIEEIQKSLWRQLPPQLMGGGAPPGGDPPASGSTTYQIPPGLSRRQKKALAALLACAVCCPGGSGSGGGVRMPNGCAPCECIECECVCWWYTTWHKGITKENLLYATLIPTPPWTLISNTLTNVGGDPDYTYLGGIGGGQISGVTAIDGNGDITTSIPPNPFWVGELTYTDGVDIVVLGVEILLSFTMSCPCGELADTVVWAGTAIVSGSLLDLVGGADYLPLPNDIIGGMGTMVNCGGNIVIAHDGVITLPDLHITPMLDPNCVPS